MYYKCLDFEQKKISRIYDTEAKVVEFNTSEDEYLDTPTSQYNKKIEEMVEKAKGNSNVIFLIRWSGDFDSSMTFDIFNRIMRLTHTDVSTGIGYLAQPTWFKKTSIHIPVSCQRDLGNFTNNFKKVQIILTNNKKEERLI